MRHDEAIGTDAFLFTLAISPSEPINGEARKTYRTCEMDIGGRLPFGVEVFGVADADGDVGEPRLCDSERVVLRGDGKHRNGNSE
jgi:hypothetical protein